MRPTFADCIHYNGFNRMKNGNSFGLKTFFEQWLPRLLALGVFAYLVYSLFLRQDEFTWLHIVALAIMLALILAPMASRLKVLNLIDFNSKLNDLKHEQQETKNQLNEIRNQISTVVSMGVSPVQQQTTIFTANGLKNIEEIFSNLKKSQGESDSVLDTRYTKERFLRRAYGYRYRAYSLLRLTLAYQIAMREHRTFEPTESIEGDTMAEKLPNLIKRVLDNGLDTVFPIVTIDEESGETRSVITPETIEGLKQINSLLDISQRLEKDEVELPSSLEIEDLFNKISDALSTVAAGLVVVGTQYIMFQNRMTSSIKALKKELEQAEIEQRPMRFPPSNSD